jgi:hypothetical protein
MRAAAGLGRSAPGLVLVLVLVLGLPVILFPAPAVAVSIDHSNRRSSRNASARPAARVAAFSATAERRSISSNSAKKSRHPRPSVGSWALPYAVSEAARTLPHQARQARQGSRAASSSARIAA